MSHHHVYLSPGMFGFGHLGSYDYFGHVERELSARFDAAGEQVVLHVIDDLPTASVRRRATRLAELVASTSEEGLVHLLGHSTGGLDARLVASPATRSIPAASLAWLPRLRSVTTMNTPHYGTPLARFFATAEGQRVLAALSVFTITGLSLGSRPLAAASVILGVIRGVGQSLPMRARLINSAISSMVGLVDDARSPALRGFLTAIEDDQGSMLQLCPESMDLFVAGFEDRPGVTYQSTASMAPGPRARSWLRTAGHPWRTVSLALFAGLHHVTASADARYPCAAMRETAPWAGTANEEVLLRALTTSPPLDGNDGVVPIRSQLWGTLVWAGLGDHLDVLGHFREDRELPPADPTLHHSDWLTSGSDFNHLAFTGLMDAIAGGMLAAAKA